MIATQYVICVIWMVGSSTTYAKGPFNGATLAREGGCITHNAEECIDADGEAFDVSATTLVPYNSTCMFLGKDGVTAILRGCQQQGQKSIWVDSLGQRHSRKRRWFRHFLHAVSTPFRAVAHGVSHVFCLIFCHHHHGNSGPTYTHHGSSGPTYNHQSSSGSSSGFHIPAPRLPPPNTRPRMTCPQLRGSSDITVESGKTTAVVSWTAPVATDKEEGRLTVRSHPNNVKSGAEYAEGMYAVSFGAMDSKGLSAQECSLSFRIRVLTCDPPRWPDNGKLKCDKYLLGSQCTVACDEGYQLASNYSTITCTKTANSTIGWSSQVSDCSAKPCGNQPTIENGIILCPRNLTVFGATCMVDCNEGYRRRKGSPFMWCDNSGNWNTPPSCEDIAEPKFDPDSCPNDIQVNIDSANNTAQVDWVIPNGTDNSNQQPQIQEKNNNVPGQRFQAGSHTISYRISDTNGNIGYPCTFIVQVQTISCQPPSLNVEGAEHMLYDCPNLYRLGATCTLSCKSAYPLGGVDQIQCLNAGNSYPPVLDWSWDKKGLRPFCKVTACPDLKGPTNGALSCNLWDHGNMCQLQCQDGFDVPLIRDGMYVCGQSNGQWLPDANVPDCNPKRSARQMHLRSDLYYYTGKCNSSAANMMQIKTNFVKALNGSKYHDACIGVPECKANFVNVTCGPVTSRRKREVDFHRNKRSGDKMAYTVTFDLVLPFNTVPGKTTDMVYTDNGDILYEMVDKIQEEVDSGHFDLPNSDTHLDSDSFGPGLAELTCPKGTMPRTSTGTCAGCPTGQSLSEGTDECVKCEVGTYQDTPASLDCKACPHGTNTTEQGARNISLCREYCAPGHFSPTGLAPCAACDSTSYQPNEKSTVCLPCDAGTRTRAEGAQSKAECKHFDIQADTNNSIRLNPQSNATSLTLSMWLMQLRTDADLIIFEVTSSDNKTYLSAAQGKQNLTLNATGFTFDTGACVKPLQWHHLVITADAAKQTVQLFLDGKSVFHTNSFAVARSLLVKDSDSVSLQGNIQLSAYYLLDRVATADEISRWSSACESSVTGALLTLDDLVLSQAARVIIPSMCDAIDECKTTPCGAHKCINKLGTFECICSGGFTGKRCQIKPDYCLENACAHGSTCLDGNTTYTCSCPYGYSGSHCERKAVDGGWTDWNDWGQCSMTCGGGQTSRSRLCGNPPPDPEGHPCDGETTQTKPCNEDKCPECSRLGRAYGVVKSCNDTDTGTRCTIECRIGLYFIDEPLPYYECGPMTDYKWNHQTDDNPLARLPACSDVKPPTQLSVSLDGKYGSVSCSKTSADTVVAALQTKLSTLDCIKKGVCNAELKPKECKPDGKTKRSTSGNKLTVAIHLHSTVDGGPDFNFSSMIGGSAPDPKLVDLVNQFMAMEESAQQIFNNSVDFFQVVVDGKPQSVAPGEEGISVLPSVRCPAGSVLLDVFCAECPAGSYSDGDRVYMCPRGQYQDQRGQSTCKQCPHGKTTRGTGSLDISECEDSNLPNDGDSSDSNKGLSIAIGVSVSAAFLAIAAAAVVFVYKYVTKSKRRVGDSLLDLQHQRLETPYAVPSKTMYSKT